MKKEGPKGGMHYKVVLLGSSGVGKTAVVRQIRSGEFAEKYAQMIGAQFDLVPINVQERRCVLEVWDTAGEEKFRSITALYVRETLGCFLVFDLTDFNSFSSLPSWITFLREESPRAQVVLFGNKSDLEDQRVVSAERGGSFAKSNDCAYFEGSAKTGQTVTDAFERRAELVLEYGHPVPTDAEPVKLQRRTRAKKKRWC
jgi:small GTP-binding protein